MPEYFEQVDRVVVLMVINTVLFFRCLGHIQRSRGQGRGTGAVQGQWHTDDPNFLLCSYSVHSL